jgi:hypothetical protein
VNSTPFIHGLKEGASYTLPQIIVSALVGTPLAAAYLTSRNVSAHRGEVLGWSVLLMFAAIFVSVAALNPIANRVLDVLLFGLYTLLLLAVNYCLAKPAQQRRHSWLRVIALSLSVLAAWLFLLLVVFS